MNWGAVEWGLLAGCVLAIVLAELYQRRERAKYLENLRRLERAKRLGAYTGPRRRRSDRDLGDQGQALVEFALVLVVALPLVLVALQLGLLVGYHLAQQQTTGTLADYLADHENAGGFEQLVQREARRIGCDHPVADGEEPEQGVVVVTLRCDWHAPFYRDATWPVTTSASAYEPRPTPAPSDSPTPEPSQEEPS